MGALLTALFAYAGSFRIFPLRITINGSPHRRFSARTIRPARRAVARSSRVSASGFEAGEGEPFLKILVFIGDEANRSRSR